MKILKKIKFIHKLKSFFLDLLFPIECLGCRQEGAWLCLTCLKQLKFNGPDLAIKLRAPNLEKIFIAGDYNDPLLALAIKKFKYSFVVNLGPILARFLSLFWQGQLIMPENKSLAEAILIPIPLSLKRWRWRGFNQAEILAREIAKNFNYSVDLNLSRPEYRTPQATLDKKERALNIQGSFLWTGKNLTGQTIILIDDVVTTGATLNEAAKILKEAGAARVYALVIAKG